MRVAAVDLGTNSTRLLVADANGALEEVVRRLEITRLGEGMVPHARTVVQEGDLLHVVMTDEQRDAVVRALATAPHEAA